MCMHLPTRKRQEKRALFGQRLFSLLLQDKPGRSFYGFRLICFEWFNIFFFKIDMCTVYELHAEQADLAYRGHRDELVGVVHHGDEQVEEDDYVDDGEGAEHEEAEVAGELLDAGQLKVVQVYQAEAGPEQRLRRLPKAANDTESTAQYSTT